MLAALTPRFAPAILALADGTVFHGLSIGAQGQTTGEMVFNTAMTGYQEILTDPSYSQQIVTLTYPHIGNYGVNSEDVEARQIFAAGLVIKDLPRVHSSFRAQQSLSEYLQEQNCVAIAGLDTRQLTRHLRTHGAQNGCILTFPSGHQVSQADISKAQKAAQSAPLMAGLDLAQIVSTTTSYPWSQGTWQQGQGYSQHKNLDMHVVAYDFGVKHNILRLLAERGCKITVVPAKTTAQDVLALQPDGIFLSNGPGDPEPCDYAITATQTLLASNIPIFGICLGHQILALACGAKTFKMKFGHHGANHPVKDLNTEQIAITSQNHGFAVDEDSLPSCLRVTHRSLFDGTIQGLEHVDKPAFCFQGHPEASPGPQDIGYLFDRFVQRMHNNGVKQNAITD